MARLGYKCTTGEYINMLCVEQEPCNELLRCTVRGWDGEPIGRVLPNSQNGQTVGEKEPVLDVFTIGAVFTTASFVGLLLGFILS